MIFKIIAIVSLKSENTLGIEMKKKNFAEAANERCSSDLYLAATINFNKTELFEGIFYCVCQLNPPPTHPLHISRRTNLIKNYKFTQLLNNLFRVG